MQEPDCQTCKKKSKNKNIEFKYVRVGGVQRRWWRLLMVMVGGWGPEVMKTIDPLAPSVFVQIFLESSSCETQQNNFNNIETCIRLRGCARARTLAWSQHRCCWCPEPQSGSSPGKWCPKRSHGHALWRDSPQSSHPAPLRVRAYWKKQRWTSGDRLN